MENPVRFKGENSGGFSHTRNGKGNRKLKKKDAVSVKRKNSAWERITTQYNSQPENTTVRTAQQLKKLRANIQYTKYVVDVYLELFLLLLRQQSNKKKSILRLISI
jgi:hypothetical protein